MKCSDEAIGYVIFRQASLSESQEMRCGAWAEGKYDKATVISCLHKLDKVIMDAKSKGSVAYLHDDDEALESGLQRTMLSLKILTTKGRVLVRA